MCKVITLAQILRWCMCIWVLVATAKCVSLPSVYKDCNKQPPSQDDFQMNKFAGNWYIIGHIWSDESMFDIQSALYHFDVIDDDEMNVTFGGFRDGSCMTPITNRLFLHSHKEAAFRVPGSPAKSLWVIETDYSSYALIFECEREYLSNVCDKNAKNATLLSRKSTIDPAAKMRFLELIESELCIDTQKLVDVVHQSVCEPNPLSRSQLDKYYSHFHQNHVYYDEHREEYINHVVGNVDQYDDNDDEHLNEDCDDEECDNPDEDCNDEDCDNHNEDCDDEDCETHHEDCDGDDCDNHNEDCDDEDCDNHDEDCDNEDCDNHDEDCDDDDCENHSEDCDDEDCDIDCDADNEDCRSREYDNDDEQSKENSGDGESNNINTHNLKNKNSDHQFPNEETPKHNLFELNAKSKLHIVEEFEDSIINAQMPNGEPLQQYLTGEGSIDKINHSEGIPGGIQQEEPSNIEVPVKNGVVKLDADHLQSANVGPEIVNNDMIQHESLNSNMTIENEEISNLDFVSLQSFEELNVDKFLGKWYNIYRQKEETGMIPSIIDLQLIDNGQLEASFVCYINGHCSVVRQMIFKPIKHQPSDWHYDTYGGVKLLYTDYTHAVVVLCNEVQRDGTCALCDTEIMILSRTLDDMTDDVMNELDGNIGGLGRYYEMGNLVSMDTTGIENCHAVLYEDSKFAEKSCKVADFTAQRNLQLEQLSGVWFEIERTQLSSRDIWDSGIVHFEVKQGSLLQLLYSGVSYENCQGPFEGHAKMTEEGQGDFVMYTGGEESIGSPWNMGFAYKVLYTDYNDAIIYSCTSLTDGGRCHSHNEHIQILSRNVAVDEDRIKMLHDLIMEKTCIEPISIVLTPREKSCTEKLNINPHQNTCQVDIECELLCNHGYIEDAEGCKTCECVEMGGPIIAYVSGDMEDEHGESGEQEPAEIQHEAAIMESIDQLNTILNIQNQIAKDANKQRLIDRIINAAQHQDQNNLENIEKYAAASGDDDKQDDIRDQSGDIMEKINKSIILSTLLNSDESRATHNTEIQQHDFRQRKQEVYEEDKKAVVHSDESSGVLRSLSNWFKKYVLNYENGNHKVL